MRYLTSTIITLSVLISGFTFALPALTSAATCDPGAAINTPGGPDPWGGCWPGPNTTGVPAGTVLTNSGSITTSSNGQVISNVNVTGTITVQNNNVTIKNSKVTGGGYTIWIKDGITGTIVQDTELDNQGSGGQNIHGDGTFLRINAHGATDGFSMSECGSADVENNYIHDMNAGPGGGGHVDPIEMDGCIHDTTVRHNFVWNTLGQNSAMTNSTYWGPVSNIDVENNLLYGGNYTIYVGQWDPPPLTGITTIKK